ncbi:hypothetical protein FKM82_010106 [Ascaphus truei]
MNRSFFIFQQIYHSPENFVNYIKTALDIFYEQVPRIFVNLVSVLDILPLKELYDDKRTRCPQTIMRALCRCVVEYGVDTPEISTLKLFNKQYQEKTRQLVESGRYDTREDFAVVIQPFLENLELPRKEDGAPDRSYMAPDCFHFAEKAHAQSARGLWTNMLEPLGQKTNNEKLDGDITIKCPSQDQPFVKTMRNSNYTYPTITPDPVHGSQLQCVDKAPSNSIPTSVHALRPADVRVVAAVGDSLTAGNGISSKPQDVLDVITQYRGLSWSIGGDSTLERVTTLPNILREFNPKITGYSTGMGNSVTHNSFLNEAVPGAKAFNLPDQVRTLIDQMKEDKRIDFQNDWKVITIFIGANDLCASCTDSRQHPALIDTGKIYYMEDFTCGLQPFFRNTRVLVSSDDDGQPDLSYLAPDCFHLSQKAHSQLSRSLWNNMLQPLGQKTETLNFTAAVSLNCPSQQQPFLNTYKNSNYKYPALPPTQKPIENWGSDLTCPGSGPSNPIPRSVHKLRPADIKVVAALGDSLTAAFGAKATGLADLSEEWRGVSWSIGGDGSLETYTTLPNILKKFNPTVRGFSTGVGKATAEFNVAVGGAKAENMVSQARTLVNKMKESQAINFKEDWKIITIFIGGNDLCQYCQNRDRYSLKNHIKHIESALDILYEEVRLSNPFNVLPFGEGPSSGQSNSYF